jgi:hypothetical protein
MGDIATAAPRSVAGNPVHLLWPRKTLFNKRAVKSFPGSLKGKRNCNCNCNCSVLLVRFLIWATRHTSHTD